MGDGMDMVVPEGADFSSPALIQGSLFSEFEQDLLTLDKPETRKRYTAATLERNVAKRDFILRCLAEGHGLLRIANAAGVSHHLVSALRDSRPDLVAIEKKQLSGQFGRIIRLAADKLEDALSKGMVPAGQIPVLIGIVQDKRAQLDGDAGLVIEHRHTVQGSVEGFRARLQAAVESAATGTAVNPQQKEQIVDVECAADTSGSGSGPGQPGDGEAGGGDAAGSVPPIRPMLPPDGGQQQKDSL